MSHSTRARERRRLRAKQKAKECRMHRNATRTHGGRRTVDLAWLEAILRRAI